MKSRAVTLLLLSAGCGAAPNGPVQLTMQPAAANGISYASDLTQSVTWHSPQRELQGERTYRIGFTITSASAAGDSIRAAARVDSMRAVMDSPHGRQVIDLRRAVGSTFTLT